MLFSYRCPPTPAGCWGSAREKMDQKFADPSQRLGERDRQTQKDGQTDRDRQKQIHTHTDRQSQTDRQIEG